jgi:hypothetical protein
VRYPHLHKRKILQIRNKSFGPGFGSRFESGFETGSETGFETFIGFLI